MNNQEEKKEKKIPYYVWGIIIFCALVLVDQLTKILADWYFDEGDRPIPIIPDLICLRITYNPGIAYGIGGDAPSWIKISIIVGTIIMMFVLSIVYFKLDDSRKLIRIALIFIVAGGVGNLIDRFYFRMWDENAPYGVRDMVDLSNFIGYFLPFLNDWFGLEAIGFGVCNFADFFIFGGAVTLILALLFWDKEAIFPQGKYKELAKAYEEELAQKKKKEEERKNSQLPKIE